MDIVSSPAQLGILNQFAHALYPDVKIDIDGQGSATAPQALVTESAQLGPMSRPMTTEESGAFEKKFGYKLAQVRVAVDALAVRQQRQSDKVFELGATQLDLLVVAARRLRQRHSELGRSRSYRRLGGEADHPLWPQ